jgi:hypothetical protein
LNTTPDHSLADDALADDSLADDSLADDALADDSLADDATLGHAEDSWRLPSWVEQTRLLLDSYVHWLGTELIVRSGDGVVDAQQLFHAGFVVVSHGTQLDPILNYGNQAALDLWEMDVRTFTSTASRYTAEPMERSERASLLERTTRDGYVDDYRGVRISTSGQRFLIEQAVVWNLLDPAGDPARILGQAATFKDWRAMPDSPLNG